MISSFDISLSRDSPRKIEIYVHPWAKPLFAFGRFTHAGYPPVRTLYPPYQQGLFG